MQNQHHIITMFVIIANTITPIIITAIIITTIIIILIIVTVISHTYYYFYRLELSKYIDTFTKAEMDGYKFISCLSTDEDIQKMMNMNHPFHRLKILSHASKLREYVLEKAAVDMPTCLEGIMML